MPKLQQWRVGHEHTSITGRNPLHSRHAMPCHARPCSALRRACPHGHRPHSHLCDIMPTQASACMQRRQQKSQPWLHRMTTRRSHAARGRNAEQALGCSSVAAAISCSASTGVARGVACSCFSRESNMALAATDCASGRSSPAANASA